MKEFVIEHTEKMEQVLQQVAKLLANNTNYTTMITAPQYHHNSLKFIQLSNVDAVSYTHLVWYSMPWEAGRMHFFYCFP